jgi:hypothetical protein
VRLLYPTLYRSIRQNKERLVGHGDIHGSDRSKAVEYFNRTLFAAEPHAPDDRVKRMLVRLFPTLESAYNNSGYGQEFARVWAMKRRVCSPDHYDSYFRFTIGDEVLSLIELDSFLGRVDQIQHVKKTFTDAVNVSRKSGGTKAAVWLTELTTHASRIDQDKVEPLLIALFEVADEINVEADIAKGFSIASNQLRLHWLLRALTKERMSLEERSTVFRRACESSSIGWLSDFVCSAWADYHPSEGEDCVRAEDCLTTEHDAIALRDLLKSRIEAASTDGILLQHPALSELLHSWNELANDDGETVRAWTKTVCASPDGVKALAKAFTTYGWAGAAGDLVAHRTTKVHIESMDRLVDLPAFRAHVESLAVDQLNTEITEFLSAWKQTEKRKNT